MAESCSIFDASRPLITMDLFTRQIFPDFKDRPAEGIYDYEDSDEDNQPDEWNKFPVNLISFDRKRLGRPIYTRKLLKEAAAKLEEAKSLISPGQEVFMRDIYGVYRIVYTVPDDPRSDELQVHYLTQVELAPDFLSDSAETSDYMAELQYLNDAKDTHIPNPIFFTSYIPKRDEPPSIAGLRDYMKTISHIKSLWLNSTSREKLCSQILSLQERNIRISKIVCFGLGGNFQSSAEGGFQPVLQHMTAFTIATILNKYQKSRSEISEEDSRVQIYLQDPSYTSFDRAILAALYGTRDLHFVSDPHGLLTIDSETLVMTAFLPKSVPLLQTLADLAISCPSLRPAAIICDKMVLDPSKEFYVIERAAPNVVHFLNSGYDEGHFEDHGIEEELWSGACGTCPYWLWSMNFWIRKEEEDREDSGVGLMDGSLRTLRDLAE